MSAPHPSPLLLLFTKPARPGRVKTRLIGDLTPEQAAELHAAFVGDVLDRLEGGAWEVRIAWALEPDEPVPAERFPGERQVGADLGARLFGALAAGAAQGRAVAALGSDHPTIPQARIDEAFARLEAGAEVVLGPAEDGGYYLIALRPEAVAPELFRGISWSTERVLAETRERCRVLGLRCELLPMGADVDTPADLRRLGLELTAGGATAAGGERSCPRTQALLASWGRLPASVGGR